MGDRTTTQGAKNSKSRETRHLRKTTRLRGRERGSTGRGKGEGRGDAGRGVEREIITSGFSRD